MTEQRVKPGRRQNVSAKAHAERAADGALPPVNRHRHANLLACAGISLLIVAHWLLATSSLRDKSVAYDETAHLTAGYSYWKFNDYRLQPENGNLTQHWAALPLVLSSDIRFPTLDQPAWRSSDVDTLGQQFLHQVGNPLEAMLRRSRAMAALLGAAVCLVVYLAARELFGAWGGALSLVLCATSPTMLAHGPLTTSDMGAALGFTLAVWCLWRLLERLTLGRQLASAVAVGALLLCKTSGVLILPMALVMIIVHLAMRRKLIIAWRSGRKQIDSWTGTLMSVGAIAAIHAAIAMALIWTACGWRYQAHAPGMARPTLNHHHSLEQVANDAGAAGKVLAWLGRQRLLPESYLYGAGYVLAEGRQRAAFLCGDYSSRGWWYYFPYCLLVKTPLALFGLLAATVLLLILNRRQPPTEQTQQTQPGVLYRLTPWLLLLAVYWAAAIGSSLNIGHRHLLPTYPAMFVLAGGAAGWLARSRLAAVLVGLLMIGFVAASACAYPHYLAYFNLLVPRQLAYTRLVDSNLDWGQDLPGLKHWLQQHRRALGDPPVYLSYFGTGSPEHYGIDATRLPLQPADARLPTLGAGIYCISATNLQAVYLAAPGRWNVTYERDYQTLGSLLDGPAAKPQTADELRLMQSGYAELQQARLFSFLRHRRPDAEVGYSILIYQLSGAEIEQALTGPPVELDQYTWQQRETLEAAR
jgi:4-amino-4-deoxy-L-arabinose transferase-like glycosyltransferase